MPYYNIQICPDNSIKMNAFDGSSPISDAGYINTTTIQTGSRYYITVSYDNTSQTISYYVNGINQVQDWIANPLPGVHNRAFI